MVALCPTREDADDDGNILVRGDRYFDALELSYLCPEKKVSREEYLGKGLSYHWKRTDEWIASREVFERRVIQIAGLNEGIAALADDGSVWIVEPWGRWLPLDGLPSGIRKKRPRGGTVFLAPRNGFRHLPGQNSCKNQTLTLMKLCKDCDWHLSTEYSDLCRFPTRVREVNPVYGSLRYPHCRAERESEVAGACGPEALNFKPREKGFLENLFGMVKP